MVDYSTFTIFQILCLLWDRYEEKRMLNALIHIDVLESYLDQRRNCYKDVDEISTAIKQKWSISLLPPFLPLQLRYQNQKLAYNPKRYSKNSYLRLLNRKRKSLQRHQHLIDRYNRRRSIVTL